MNLSVLELRQYTLKPGRRDELVELFDREFVTGQEACGMRVLGQFLDADDPDRFVWLRGFAECRPGPPRSPRSTADRSGGNTAPPRTRP